MPRTLKNLVYALLLACTVTACGGDNSATSNAPAAPAAAKLTIVGAGS